jgi:hypothetical protein
MRFALDRESIPGFEVGGRLTPKSKRCPKDDPEEPSNDEKHQK